MYVRYLLLIFVICSPVNSTLAADRERDEINVKPTLQYGAQIYVERCVLCHGIEGKGKGLIPKKIKNYPSTNLHTSHYPAGRNSIKKNIIYGGSLGKMSNLMPPMGNDLTWSQLESVVDFILLLRSDPSKANTLIGNARKHQTISRRIGREIFKGRCVLCHGKFGEGDGRMARVIKNPPPFDLTSSRLPDSYLNSIISKGGEAMGRSLQMPPWKDELSGTEIESVILYIKSLRD
ncbi:MAG: cytochrome c [Gammaproteobacteria bacterium]|nr:MAG: cytochrome c [Gammaproteobacteria bacterium]PCI71646.1 MAG: cytochrome c [Gammaproteobacteria bacterium]